MRIRTVIAGILGAAICFPFLWLQYYRVAPAKFVLGWAYVPPLPDWTTTAVFIFCGITIFAFGWVAARWNWDKNWKASLLSGAGAGSLAGCLIFDFIGAFWLGLSGQTEILQNFYNPLSEAEGMRILLEAVFKTGASIYLNFGSIILACTVAGLLGGLTSVLVDAKDFWGTRPRRPEGWLFRLPAYTLVVTGVLNMIVTIAVLRLLWEKSLNSAIEINKKYDIQWTPHAVKGDFLILSYMVGLLFILIPIGITWGWFIQNWRIRGKPNLLSLLWTIITVAGVGYVLSQYISNQYEPYDYMIFFPFVLILALIVSILIGLMTNLKNTDGSKPSFSDWVGHALAFGIFGGTQIVIGATAYAISLALIAIINIPHLVGTGLVEQSPVDQVRTLHGMLTGIARGFILVCIILGFIVAWLTSLFRAILGIKDMPTTPGEP